MKSTTTQTLTSKGSTASMRAGATAVLNREARAWISAMPITLLLAAILDGLRTLAQGH